MPEPQEDLTSEKLKSMLEENENYWNNNIKSLSKRLICSAKDVVDLQVSGGGDAIRRGQPVMHDA